MSDSAQMRAEPATGRTSSETDIGSVFVSNYPPYSFWNAKDLDVAASVLEQRPSAPADLGLYLHIPFCRKRCKFCYFRVFTDKAAGDIERYLNGLAAEVEQYTDKPRLLGRSPRFVYFGGGTPSYISARHLRSLVERLQGAMPWNRVEEVAFECEPGTLTQAKLEAIREIGVTRLSLGVENLDDEVLAENGRAHVSTEVYRVMPWIKGLGFDQVNVDLIAGMVGDSWERWRDTVARTIELDPDSITVYQMELPFNTVYSKSLMADPEPQTVLADWPTKRAWHAYAFAQFAAAGYRTSSAYTVVKADRDGRFVYRDAVWRGAEMVGAGVASFGHMGGVHLQNVTGWDDYLEAVEAGRLPLGRAYAVSDREALTREVILQLKTGRLDVAYFRDKYRSDIISAFAPAWERLRDEGALDYDDGQVRLTPAGLLRVDGLLPALYAPEHRNARYT